MQYELATAGRGMPLHKACNTKPLQPTSEQQDSAAICNIVTATRFRVSLVLFFCFQLHFSLPTGLCCILHQNNCDKCVHTFYFFRLFFHLLLCIHSHMQRCLQSCASRSLRCRNNSRSTCPKRAMWQTQVRLQHCSCIYVRKQQQKEMP